VRAEVRDGKNSEGNSTGKDEMFVVAYMAEKEDLLLIADGR